MIEGADAAYTFANNSANGTAARAGTLNFGGPISGGTAGNTVLSLVGSNTNNNSISGVITNGSASTLGIAKSGPGTWVLSGVNTYSGNTTITGGTLLLDNNTGAGSLNSGTSLIFGGSGTFNIQANSAGSSQTLGDLVVNAGQATVQSTNNGGTASLNFSSIVARPLGASRNFVVQGGTNGSTNKIAIAGQATGFMDAGTFFGGNSYAFYDAGGFVRGINYGTDPNSPAAITTQVATLGSVANSNVQFGGTIGATTTAAAQAAAGNTITVSDATGLAVGNLIQGTNIPAGTTITGISSNTITMSASSTAVVPNAAAITAFAAVSAQPSVTLNTLSLTAPTRISLSSGSTLTTSGILKSGGSATAVISDGTGVQAPANGELEIRTDTAGDTLAINNPILANGTSSLAKTGAGTLSLVRRALTPVEHSWKPERY